MTASSSQQTVIARFIEVAQHHPGRTAVTWRDNQTWKKLTYTELFDKARATASELARAGVEEGSSVILPSERHPDLCANLLGILFCGAHYVFIDANYPKERQHFITEAVSAKFGINAPGSDLLNHLDISWINTRNSPQSNVEVPDIPENSERPAYVMFTSGSTGEPKGVVVPDRAILRLVTSTDFISFSPEQTFLQLSALSFDASTLELWGPLLNGGTCVLHPETGVLTPNCIRDVILERDVSTLWLTASLFNTFIAEYPDYLKPVKQLLTGGEALSVPHVRKALEHLPSTALFNGYGPTENTTFTTVFPIPRPLPEDIKRIPIGFPIPGTQCALVDSELNILEGPDQTGELIAFGDGLALGYLNRPELTAEKFIQVKASDGRSRTGYRTGDLAQLNDDGSYDYLGRIDKQVKIDGHRIEPGEIEYQLNNLEFVTEARVIVRIGPQGQKRLAAYLVSESGFSTQSVRQALAEVVPAYMIPHFIVQVSELPKNKNGKLDEARLPDPYATAPKDAPQASRVTKDRIQESWNTILNRPVEDTDNFMDAGGTSLEALKLATLLERTFEVELSATFVFEYPTIQQQANFFATRSNADDTEASARRGDRNNNEFAIIGMACRFPGANNLDEYWQNLLAGKETVSFFTDDELSPDVSAEERSNPAYVKAKGIVEGYDRFDAKFFGISPIEARVMDPQQRILLELSWHALEDAGIPPGDAQYRTGVFAGMNWARYYQQYVLPNKEIIDSYGVLNCGLANEPDLLSTRISYKLNLKGPSINVFTACSTGLVAVAQACEAIDNGQCEQAIAAGVSISTPVKRGYAYQEGSMLSKDGHCRPFDQDATGTTFNDGAGAIVLKRRDLAERDGDTIYAVIKGYAVNNDGEQKASFTAPSVAGQVAVYKDALARAAIEPSSVGFIETHGTATPLGDPIEVLSLRRCYSSENTREKTCAIGSVKSNIGHAIHAAGLASLIKSTLAVRDNKIPPTLFFQTANPKLELEKSHFYVNTAVEAWKLPSPRRAAVTSLGVGGTNAHVILEEYVPGQAPELPKEITPELRFPILLSAKSKPSLERQIARYCDYFSNRKDALLPNVSHTSIHGRKHFDHRAIVFGGDLPSAMENLGQGVSFAKGQAGNNPNQSVGFMFSGQGTQARHMGKWLYENSSSYRETFDRGCKIVLKTSGVDIRGILFAEGDQNADDNLVNQTSFVQPALFLLEFGLANYLKEHGVAPSFLIGHSIGEFAAAALAGIFSFEDAVALVATRGALMQSMPAGKMLIVRSNPDDIEELIGQRAEVAAVNAPGLMVLSGEQEAIKAISAELSERKIASTILQTSHAFHSSMMDPIVPEFEAFVSTIQRQAPSIPIYSTMTGALLTDEEAMSPRYWSQQLRNPVLFSSALQALSLRHENDGERISLLEVGPGNTLVNLANSHRELEGIHAYPALTNKGTDENAEDDIYRSIGQLWVDGHALDWNRYFEGLWVCKERLPGYAFSDDSFWLGPVNNDPANMTNSVAPSTAAASQLSHLANPATPVTQDVKMDSKQHSEKIRADVMAIIEDVSGYELGDADPASHFSEVGLDSLLLTQVATALERQFKLGITFRHLVEEYTSLELISEFIASQVEPEVVTQAAPPSQEAAGQPQPADGSQMSMPSGVDFSTAMPTSGGHIQDIVNAQLQIMQMQLQALGRQGASTAQSVPQTQQAAASTPAPAAAANKERASANESADDTPSKPAHTPGTRITREKTNTEVTSAQREWIDRLMTKYQEKYAGSKSYTQKHRKHLADPRSVSGFNPGWKEVIFPIVTVESKGSKLWDIDGNELIDTSNGFGPILFGHSPDFISNAAKAQIDRGVETGPQSPLAGEVAELFCELTGNERCTFACTGSEANVGALRVARTVTGRTKVVAFEGSYHGIHDEVVMRVGKDHKALPAAPGVPREATSNMILLPWGEQSSLDEIRKLGDEIAAVLVEPVQSRKPQFHSKEYIQEIRRITKENGVALILDEVVTGFRVGPGGIRKRFDVDADMMTYGKVVGGGYPIGIIAGKAKYLDAMDGGYWEFGDDSIPEQGVTFFAGTFVRHPLALAVAKAVLTKIKEDGDSIYPALEEKTTAMAREAKAFIEQLKSNVSFEEFASLFYISIPPTSHWGHLLFLSMTLDGIHIQQYRPNFLTTQHSTEDVKKILQAFKSALANLIVNGLLEGDQVAAKKYLSGNSSIPAGARLGKNEKGEPAYFIEDPDNKGAYVEVGRP
ncbi:amino acid adenylation domain-containing protein [Marinobacter salarius]|uniref:amino acid adenylation domain-containing protein n=1 Tax=Marinobacter salarius TaxID=1420917 RepID=UPI003D9BFE41